MGYRCPACREDFGRDKEKFNQHVATAHGGGAKPMVDAVENWKKKDKSK